MFRPLTFAALAAVALAGPVLAVPAPGDEAPPAAREEVSHAEATTILGRKVLSPTGKEVGRIVNVLVDEMGQPRAAVIDFGGFMGIGNRRIAVVWRALHFAPAEDGRGRITLELTPDQIKAVPEYRDTGRPVTVAAPVVASAEPMRGFGAGSGTGFGALGATPGEH